MPKTRAQKEAQLAELTGLLAGKAVVLVKYAGLGVRQLEKLRSKLRAIGGTYRVVKTSLLGKALEAAKLEIPAEHLTVQLALAAHPTDEVEPQRAVVQYAKEHEALGILGAIVDRSYLDEAGVRHLASLPGRDELYAKVVGSLAAPMSGMLNVLAGNLRGFVSVLHQYQQQKAG